MKRDLELFRAIMQGCEDHKHGFAPRDLEKGLEYTDEQIGYHTYLLGEAGYMNVTDVTNMGSKSPKAVAISLRNAGYDFLEYTKVESIWKKTKSKVQKVGAWTLPIVADVAKDYLKEQFNIK